MDEVVWVRYESSPIEVESNNGDAHMLSMDLESGVKAVETFDPEDGRGVYALTLSKEATNLADVWPTHNQLLDCLRRLSLVWTFSGGAPMKLQTEFARTSPGYTTNAEEVEESLRSKAGLSRVSTSILFSYMVFAKYSTYPLATATELARAADSDFHLRLMLEYFQQARLDDRAWFIHLYKVRDTLAYAAKKHGIPVKKFDVDKTRWRKFGRWLNKEYDLRHPRESDDTAPVIDSAKRNELFQIGAEMIRKYMDFSGIDHL